MIAIRTKEEIELLRRAGEIVGETHHYLEKFIKPGITTKELDKLAYDFIISKERFITSRSFRIIYNREAIT